MITRVRVIKILTHHVCYFEERRLCRDGLVGYDASFTRMRSRVRLPVFVSPFGARSLLTQSFNPHPLKRGGAEARFWLLFCSTSTNRSRVVLKEHIRHKGSCSITEWNEIDLLAAYAKSYNKSGNAFILLVCYVFLGLFLGFSMLLRCLCFEQKASFMETEKPAVTTSTTSKSLAWVAWV